MKKAQREQFKQLAATAAPYHVEIRYRGSTGSGHVRWQLRHRKTGETRGYTGARSTSDHRAIKNMQARVKRICQDMDERTP